MTSELRRAALARIRAPGSTANRLSHWDIPKACPTGTSSGRSATTGTHGTTGTNGTGGTLGTGGTAAYSVRIDPADTDERAALLEHDGGIPSSYADEFARLQQACPAGVPEPRWRQFINDGGVFLDRWGNDALRLGWTAADLFGLDPAAPLARYDRMGVVWLLRGQAVAQIGKRAAVLCNALIYRIGTTATSGDGNSRS